MGHAWFSSVIQTEVPKQTAWVETNQGTCLSTTGLRPFRKATPPSQFSTRNWHIGRGCRKTDRGFCFGSRASPERGRSNSRVLAKRGYVPTYFPLSRFSTALIMAPHSVRAAVKSFAVRFVPLR